ncbi:MAG: chromosome segregation protein SMC [Cycloclasticus sp.]|nr:chromosome segregation protein SMC [Cycloclasticus sp.]
MRLEKIKLSGFKSFVDPTTIPFTSDLVGIVGPNGCGKSNVIDAVRWVLGESSAKHLRGDQMADVIFNGSTTRKPVGQAFVELVFDNSDATITGEFASYRQISLKRQVNREGQSVYFLNGSRCRRKDITDLFLGTGLGPRSYAIIEQGTISRLIEAKPDELRVFLEEAAGISKYKERRRDTENRMRRTRENLERIADLCEEIDKQCRHLKRQASTAERYKVLKAEERQLKAELLALRWQGLHEQDESQHQTITQLETKVEETLSAQRELEANIEKQREEHNTQRETLAGVQADFYAIGSDIAKLEQAIQHQQNLKQQQQDDLTHFNTVLEQSQQELARGDEEIIEADELIKATDLALEDARQQETVVAQSLVEIEQQMSDWQKAWDEFTYQVAEPKRKIDVEKTKIAQLDRQLVQLAQRLAATQSEQNRLQKVVEDSDLTGLQEQHDSLNSQYLEDQTLLLENQHSTSLLRTVINDENDALAELRAEHSRLAGRLESIIVLQQANSSDSQQSVERWLDEMGLAKASKLIEEIDVVPGWEKAVEAALGKRLQAVCVSDMDAILTSNIGSPAGELTLFNIASESKKVAEKTSLASLISSDLPSMLLLKNIHFAETVEQAKVLLGRLEAHESVMTKDGVWLNADSVSFLQNESKNSALVLEREKKSLTRLLQEVSEHVVQKETVLVNARAELSKLESLGRTLRQQETDAVQQVSRLAMQINDKKSALELAQQRLLQVAVDFKQITQSKSADEASLLNSKQVLERAIEQSTQIETQRDVLQQERSTIKSALDGARREVHRSRELTHNLMLKTESLRSSQALTNQNLQAVKERMKQAADKVADLQAQLTISNEPLDEQMIALEGLLKKRITIDDRLISVRSSTESIDQLIRQLETARHGAEQQVQQARENVSEAKIIHQEVLVRKQTLVEQLQESGVELAETLSNMSDGANEAQWQSYVATLAEKINRLGLINLAAIDEYEAQSERKQYLDKQQLDLTESLKTLKSAIDKIDKESRALFKQTFDKVNAGFEKRFPKLFGGGHAYLQQTGEDLLETGVTVMARPPGKRNSSIHLLSGGEKALTAVALVFSIFDLNPSPFCMLDEVDAPLDEANVGRFGHLVKEMSENVQMILITHNKATMEMAHQLAGVTMKEPGVSRLVAVDLEEAAKMAAS